MIERFNFDVNSFSGPHLVTKRPVTKGGLCHFDDAQDAVRKFLTDNNRRELAEAFGLEKWESTRLGEELLNKAEYEDQQKEQADDCEFGIDP